jgi:xanthine dehydrogenase YagR molybdenum-binding subunit
MIEAPVREAPPVGTPGGPGGPAIGRPIDRVDGHAKTSGQARYAAEHPHPDLAHAALSHATVARGRITAIDTAAAAETAGVIAVLTHENAPRLQPPRRQSLLDLSTLAQATSVPYLNTDEVHWDGQPVAVVVAETLDAALEAAALVRVTYDQRPAVVDFAAEAPNAKLQPSTPMMPAGAKRGDAAGALAQSSHRVDLRFTTPPHHHNAMEPHATTALWEGDRLTVHDATQAIDWTRKHLAHTFGVPLPGVRVVSTFVGGGFGGKGSVWPGTILTALAARVVGRPVRMMLTREGVYRTVGGRTPSIQRVALGAGEDGRLRALIHTSVTRRGRIGGVPEQVTSSSHHLYNVPNLLLEQRSLDLDMLSNTSMRAPGDSIGSFALESAVDELAYTVGIDPIELRLRNEPARNPADGRRFSHRRLREAYALGAERFRWGDRTPEPGSMRDGRWQVGIGVAAAYHPSWEFFANVTVRLGQDGTVLVRCAFHEMGMGGATAQGQIAADLLGVPFEAVRVEYGDSALPVGPPAGGSAQTASVAASLDRACARLRRAALALAARSPGSPLRGLRPRDVEARDGGLHRAGGPAAGESYRTILARAGRQSLEVRVGADTGIGAVIGQARFMGRLVIDGRRWVRAASGAQFCEVRVDPDTGEVRVSRWLGVFDIGRVVNAKLAGSQLRGGIVMGIGMGLEEETLVDPRSGRIVNAGMAEYHVPVQADVPPIEIACLDDPDPTAPLGILGAGEVGITGAAAAIGNAIRHATGRRICDLPITLDKLL